MKNTIKAKAKVNFGKLNLYGTGKRYPAEVTIELRERGGEETFTVDAKGNRTYTGKTTPTYTELSIRGKIWNSKCTDLIMCGQCLDDMNLYLKGNAKFQKLYKWWKAYHLNGMHAGTPEQEAVIDEWKANGNTYDYDLACALLKEKGLYDVEFTGKTTGRMYDHEPYKYGHGWVIEDIPEDVLTEIEKFIMEER